MCAGGPHGHSLYPEDYRGTHYRCQTDSGWGFGTTYDPRKAILEAIGIGLCFLGNDWRAVLAIVTVAFIVLRMRDWFIHPAKATISEAATDTLVMAVMIVASQLYFVYNESTSAVNTPEQLSHGVGWSMLWIFSWRLWFHLQTPQNDFQQEPEMRVVRSAARLNIMFGLAVSFIVGSGLQAVPGSHLRDQVLAALMISAGIIRRLLTDSYLLPAPVLLSIKDPVTVEMDNSVAALPRLLPGKQPYSTRTVLLFVLIFLGSVFSSTGIGLWRLWTGQIVDVNWIQLITNLIGLAVLAPLWWMIMEFNTGTAQVVEQSIEQRKKNCSAAISSDL
jgi:hypothetical protein